MRMVCLFSSKVSQGLQVLGIYAFGGWDHEVPQGWWLEWRQLSSLAMGGQEGMGTAVFSPNFATSTNTVEKWLDFYLAFLKPCPDFRVLQLNCRKTAPNDRSWERITKKYFVDVANFTTYFMSHAVFHVGFSYLSFPSTSFTFITMIYLDSFHAKIFSFCSCLTWEALSIIYICFSIVSVNSNRSLLVIKKIFFRHQDLKKKKQVI